MPKNSHSIFYTIRRTIAHAHTLPNAIAHHNTCIPYLNTALGSDGGPFSALGSSRLAIAYLKTWGSANPPALISTLSYYLSAFLKGNFFESSVLLGFFLENFIPLSLSKIEKSWVIEKGLPQVKDVCLQQELSRQKWYIESKKKFWTAQQNFQRYKRKQVNLA